MRRRQAQRPEDIPVRRCKSQNLAGRLAQINGLPSAEVCRQVPVLYSHDVMRPSCVSPAGAVQHYNSLDSCQTT